MTRFPFYPNEQDQFYSDMAGSYHFIQSEPTPWSPLKRSLTDIKVSMVTTAGLRLTTQFPYNIHPHNGSSEYRTLPFDAHRKEMILQHNECDLTMAGQDINVVAPIDRLIDMKEQQWIGELADHFYSFTGPARDLEALRESARQVGKAMKDEGVGATFLFPAGPYCTQSVGLIAREIERCGISTCALVLVKEMAESVILPRALFINFPFGSPMGKAGDVNQQMRIAKDLVDAMKGFDRPGRIIDLQYSW